MSSKKKNIYVYLGKVILVTLLIVLLVRSFFLESFSVSSAQMETTLLKGDKILINKTAYGIRMPVTLLSIPFTFDKIFGMKAYSTALQAPYKRFFAHAADRDDIVLFNNPLETDKPLDKRSLLLSRCIALPGDSIRIESGLFIINGRPYLSSPGTIEEYYFRVSAKKELEDVAKGMHIPMPLGIGQGDSIITQLSKYDAFVLNESLSDSLTLVPCKKDTLQSHTFLIPFKGKIIDLSESNLVVYKQIILQELEGQDAKIEDGELLINGIKQTGYTFEDSYYWMLSDNRTYSTDSRSIGFIPFSSIIGKACLIWHSSDENGTRAERCFSSIK
ncbi:signal peptidase I [Dysgonomonas termitidis]|uniref:Signal peptidase I n=1 Tax=Dysgonomonas termitidis TaxID=1516126 RepID=A0ABV9KT98_9BACT